LFNSQIQSSKSGHFSESGDKKKTIILPQTHEEMDHNEKDTKNGKEFYSKVDNKYKGRENKQNEHLSMSSISSSLSFIPSNDTNSSSYSPQSYFSTPQNTSSTYSISHSSASAPLSTSSIGSIHVPRTHDVVVTHDLPHPISATTTVDEQGKMLVSLQNT
jgi:hypothetical protein